MNCTGIIALVPTIARCNHECVPKCTLVLELDDFEDRYYSLPTNSNNSTNNSMMMMEKRESRRRRGRINNI
jgi:hypothetical protein